MNDKMRRILDKSYGAYLAKYDKAARNNDRVNMQSYELQINVLKGLYSGILGVPIDWKLFDTKMRESVYYSLA